MRRRALELVERTEEDLTDAELMRRADDDFWYIDLCLEQLHRLPSEIDPILLCSEYTILHAHSIVKRAMGELSRKFTNNRPPQGLGG